MESSIPNSYLLVFDSRRFASQSHAAFEAAEKKNNNKVNASKPDRRAHFRCHDHIVSDRGFGMQYPSILISFNDDDGNQCNICTQPENGHLLSAVCTRAMTDSTDGFLQTGWMVLLVACSCVAFNVSKLFCLRSTLLAFKATTCPSLCTEMKNHRTDAFLFSSQGVDCYAAELRERQQSLSFHICTSHLSNTNKLSTFILDFTEQNFAFFFSGGADCYTAEQLGDRQKSFYLHLCTSHHSNTNELSTFILDSTVQSACPLTCACSSSRI